MVWSGIMVEDNAQALAGTIQMFEATLVVLCDFLDQLSIKPAPTPGVKVGFNDIVADWGVLKPVLEKAVAGQVADDATCADTLARLNTMLGEMNAVVGLYEI